MTAEHTYEIVIVLNAISPDIYSIRCNFFFFFNSKQGGLLSFGF